jgi:hypothetical protein
MSEHWRRIGKLVPGTSCPAGATIINTSPACLGATAGIASRG